MSRAEDVLGSRGEKLHTHSIHIRRIAEGKFVASHEMRNKHGDPPSDPRRATREYGLDDHKHLARHVEGAMAPDPDASDEAGEAPGPEPGEPGEAGGAGGAVAGPAGA